MQSPDLLSPDLHALVQYALKTLGQDVKDIVAAEKADFASQAHLVACQSRIERMLAPELNEVQPRPSFMMMGRETPGAK